MSCLLLYRPTPPEEASTLAIPLFKGKIRCGMSRFPSPAEAFAKEKIDLNKRFISNPPSTVLGYAGDRSMVDIGIFPGDLLIIDKSLSYGAGSICVFAYYGEFICKRLSYQHGQMCLLSENQAESAFHPPIQVSEEETDSVSVFGVVKYVIHQPE